MTMKIMKGRAWRCGINVDEHSVSMAVTFPVRKVSRPEYGNTSGKKDSQESIRIIDLKDDTAVDLELLPSLKTGNVYDIEIDFGRKTPSDYGYQLIKDGRIVDDMEAAAVRRRKDETINLFCMPEDINPKEDDEFLPTAFRDMCLYKVHVGGFTKHPSSKVKAPGTFEGVLEKLDYIKSLGMNTIELMPIYDFMQTEKKSAHKRPRTNYWGYGPARFMAVKPEYANNTKQPEQAFKHFVNALHQAGMTVIMEIVFTDEESMSYQQRCLRHWRYTYHVDGFHVSAKTSNMRELLNDPYLSDTLIFAENFDGSQDKSSIARRAVVHDGFLESGRAYLRGDVNTCSAFKDNFLMTWTDQGKINYMAGHNGMTLVDMLTYDKKHNEKNGEHNLDGTDHNFSCNYGHEGPDCGKAIAAVRKRQQKNTLMMILLSEGIPMLMAGDECGRTQLGNNNAWCQDNQISWFDWNNVKENGELIAFVREILQLRKKSAALHAKNVPTYADRFGTGFPDLSVHGIEPWLTDYLDVLGFVGFMYANAGEIIYAAFNMGVLDLEVALPTVKNRKWQLVLSTQDESTQIAKDGRSFSILTNSVSILKAV